MDRSYLIAFAIAFASLAFVASFYGALPQRVASHWGAAGEVNGYSDKDSVFVLPVITLVLTAIFSFLPRIDPLKRNFTPFLSQYQLFVIALAVFLAYLSFLTVAWNLGWVNDFMRFLAPAFALLFWVMGALLKEAKRNWFVGVRTPWTLSSDFVWDKTNGLAGRGAQVYAVVFLIAGLLFPQAFLLPLIALLLVGAAAVIAYSYFLWRQESAKPAARRVERRR